MVSLHPAQDMKRADHLRQIRDLEEGLRHTTPGWERRLQQWEDSVASDQPDWQVVPAVHEGERGAILLLSRTDPSGHRVTHPPNGRPILSPPTRSRALPPFRFEQLTDPNLPCSGPGRSIFGMAALSEFKVEAADATNPTNKVQVKFVKATADFSNPERPRTRISIRQPKGAGW